MISGLSAMRLGRGLCHGRGLTQTRYTKHGDYSHERITS